MIRSSICHVSRSNREESISLPDRVSVEMPNEACIALNPPARRISNAGYWTGSPGCFPTIWVVHLTNPE